jgi:serine/threonine protein kinase
MNDRRWTPHGFHATASEPQRSEDSVVAPRPLSEITDGLDEFSPMSFGRPAPVSGYLRPGTRLGDRYETIRPLSAGGMAEIHLARVLGDEGFEKLVVLKRILAELADDPYYVEMFLGEARVAAMMNHPNVAQAFDLGKEGHEHYYVMELIDGADLIKCLLAARDLGRAFGIAPTVSVGLGVSAGLAHAHSLTDLRGVPQGVVHRDVSPANVLITRDGHVKLVDFGIAKAATQKSITRSGTRKGKLSYMSPEQLLGQPVDHRSDLFSLGILLYESSTMTRLFRGPNELAVINQIVESPIPPPSARDPEYPSELERIVMKCLSRDPAARHQTADELHSDLEAFAFRERLFVSPSILQQTMAELFGAEKTHVYPDA